MPRKFTSGYIAAAYGRSYPTKEAAISAWKEGLDFKLLGGPYCSVRDIELLKKQFPGGVYLEYGPTLATVRVC